MYLETCHLKPKTVRKPLGTLAVRRRQGQSRPSTNMIYIYRMKRYFSLSAVFQFLRFNDLENKLQATPKTNHEITTAHYITQSEPKLFTWGV